MWFISVGSLSLQFSSQALQSLHQAASEKLEELSEITATPTSQLKFVLDAWAQVVDCRRILKWTYAYGYYRFGEQAPSTKSQQEFFEFNQGQAEYYLEKLNGEVEKQLDLYMKNNKESASDSAEWRKYREMLIGLTDVTYSHFTKLVQVCSLQFPAAVLVAFISVYFLCNALSLSPMPSGLTDVLCFIDSKALMRFEVVDHAHCPDATFANECTRHQRGH